MKEDTPELPAPSFDGKATQPIHDEHAVSPVPSPITGHLSGDDSVVDFASSTRTHLGRYRLIQKLGEGGMGLVWLAHDEQLDVRIALKIPRIAMLDAVRRQRFRREAHIVAQLNHPRICRIYDAGEIDGVPYLSMAFIEGDSLDQFLSKRILTPIEKIRLTAKIAHGLFVAHQAGVIHRDLKPGNVMIDRAGEPVIMDFGLARRDDESEDITREGAFFGTPGYMAPEQLESRWQQVGPASDQFSLGVMLYDLLTARKPFAARGLFELRQAIENREIRPPSETHPHLPREIDAIVRRMLAPKIEDRYPSVADVATELEQLADRMSAPPTVPHKRSRIAPLVAIAASVLIIATAGLLWMTRTTPVVPPEIPREIVNSLGMTFVRIDPGHFEMGSPPEQWGRSPNESPLHRVTISKPFYLAKYEVTIEQFRRFIQETGYLTTAEHNGSGGAGFDLEKGQMADWGAKYNWRNPGMPQLDSHPVVMIDWRAADQFTKWLSKREDRSYRLPTEAEWEYVCRAGTSTAYPTSNQPDSVEGTANIADVSLGKLAKNVKWALPWDDHFPYTAPVGSFPPNAFGICDMLGNAMEWTADYGGPYPAEPQTDPTGPATGIKRVARGGGWYLGTNLNRCADRVEELPTAATCYFGFRVALIPE